MTDDRRTGRPPGPDRAPGDPGVPSSWPGNLRSPREDRSANPRVPHGTIGGYNAYKCSCPACRRANAEYHHRYKKEHGH
jgi:hypothetical protein